MFEGAAAAMLKAGVNKMLQSDTAVGLLERYVGRYAEVRSLSCGAQGGLEAVVRVKGFTEEVKVCLRRVEVAPDSSAITPTDIVADREGIDALLKDFVQGRRFDVPEVARPFMGMLKGLF